MAENHSGYLKNYHQKWSRVLLGQPLPYYDVIFSHSFIPSPSSRTKKALEMIIQQRILFRFRGPLQPRQRLEWKKGTKETLERPG